MDAIKVRISIVIDDYNLQYLGFVVGRLLSALRITRVLENFIDYHGKPKRLRVDNGPENTSHQMHMWSREDKIELHFFLLGKTTQNNSIARFNQTYRTEVLDG
jgi:putative transposase